MLTDTVGNVFDIVDGLFDSVGVTIVWDLGGLGRTDLSMAYKVEDDLGLIWAHKSQTLERFWQDQLLIGQSCEAALRLV